MQDIMQDAEHHVQNIETSCQNIVIKSAQKQRYSYM